MHHTAAVPGDVETGEKPSQSTDIESKLRAQDYREALMSLRPERFTSDGKTIEITTPSGLERR